MNDLFELTPEQKKAWNAIKRAHKKAEKLNLFWYNNYGIVGVCDKAKINGYADHKNGGYEVEDIGQNPNEMGHPAGDSWADDQHFFHTNQE